MAYTTHLSPTVTATSKDIKLSRTQTVREHTIIGLAVPVRIVQDRTKGGCEIYVSHKRVTTVVSLSSAYEIAMNWSA